MCILYALKAWFKYGGYLLFTFQPKFHLIACTPKGIIHGTTKSYNKCWRIEKLDAFKLANFFIRAGRK